MYKTNIRLVVVETFFEWIVPDEFSFDVVSDRREDYYVSDQDGNTQHDTDNMSNKKWP